MFSTNRLDKLRLWDFIFPFKILTTLPQHPLPRLKVFLTFISCGEAALWETSHLVGCGAPVFLPLGPFFLLAGFGRAQGISAAPKGNWGLSSRGWAATHGAAAPGNLALIGNFTTFQHSRQTPGAGQEITLNSCDRVYTAVRSWGTDFLRTSGFHKALVT